MMKKILIIGAGIAGLTAGIYSSRANLKPVILSGKIEGGQLMLTTDVENYPGFEEGILGPQLIQNLMKQAEKFGTEIISENVINIAKKGNTFEVKTDKQTIETQTVIIATGASARWLGLESEKKYTGKGVSSCATCDGYFFQDKEIAVVGGGDSACEEALFLTKFAKKITIIHRRNQLRASKIMQDRVFKNEKIQLLWDSEIKEIEGNEQGITNLKIQNIKNQEITDLKVEGLFVAIGHIPNTKIFETLIREYMTDHPHDTDRILKIVESNKFSRSQIPFIMDYIASPEWSFNDLADIKKLIQLSVFYKDKNIFTLHALCVAFPQEDYRLLKNIFSISRTTKSLEELQDALALIHVFSLNSDEQWSKSLSETLRSDKPHLHSLGRRLLKWGEFFKDEAPIIQIYRQILDFHDLRPMGASFQ